ncbi:hypothetical protein [Roseivirga sp.]|uniref:hypothetical protein n=1 Tax=Roseivirga sp. TaxID=1964215 RepID=UPI003B529F35
MEAQLNQTNDQTKSAAVLPEITRLTEQLLFTWGHLEEQSNESVHASLNIRRRQNLLDVMVDDAYRMADYLTVMKRAIKAL